MDTSFTHSYAQNGQTERVRAIEGEELIPGKRLAGWQDASVDAEATDDLTNLPELHGQNVRLGRGTAGAAASANRLASTCSTGARDAPTAARVASVST
jgi:hypothetical protein